MSDLFRKDVLERQGQRILGDIVLASPISHASLVSLLAVIIAGLITFSIFGEYSRKERVIGYLTPDRGLIRLLPSHAGVIEQINIEIGRVVDKGDSLFSIKTDTLSGYGHETASTLLEQLQSEKLELERRRAQIPRQFDLTQKRLRSQVLAARSESDRFTSRIALQEKAVKNERIVFEKFQQLLGKGTVSELDAWKQEILYLEARQSLQSLHNEHQRLVDRASDLEAQISLLPISEQQEIGDVSSRLSSLEQRVTQTQGQQRYVVTAPVAGRIASLTAKEGQLADVRRAMATILPIGGRLDAELLVPSRAAGFVKEGQSVHLLYDAFPYQKFGFHPGTVSKVSRTVIAPTDLPIAPSTQEPVFVITVTLDRQEIDADDQVYELQSGMTLAADIILEDRKIWQWALEPILWASKN